MTPTHVEARKACSACAVEKPLEAFYRDRHRPDGVTVQCRDCQQAKARLNSDAKAEQRRARLKRQPLRDIWEGMMRRCYAPGVTNFKNYGGRGITVTPEWSDYAAFQSSLTAAIGPRPSRHHTLDRIDVDGNYEPSNVRWATWSEQNHNRRNNVWLSHDGRTQVLLDWARELGVNPSMLQNRLRSGWSVERTLTTPSRSRKPWRAAS